jgi:glycosyltransferase involved in cell wall biosynthesis
VREKIREILSKEKIDLVHVDMLPLSVYINEFKELPKILVNHNVESMRLYRWFQTESNPVKKAYLGMQYPKLKAFERSSMEQFDSCVVVSEKDKELLRGMGVKNTIAVVPNGTDTSFFKPMGREKINNSVLWLGHMDVHTNKDAVLYFWREIFPLLQKQYPQVRMVIVGSAPPKEIADASRKDGNIKVTGFVDDVRPHMDEANVMIVPLRIGSGTRLKILDAMAMGKAIVSTSVGCEGLKVTDGENILIADKPEDFVRKVIQLLADDGLRQKLSDNALKIAKEYDWEHLYGIQEKIYQEIRYNNAPTSK